MSFDYAAVFEAIEENKDETDVSKFMQAVIGVCKKIEPCNDWDLFLDLDFNSEVSLLSNHVISVLGEEPADFDIQGFWFGINNPVLESGETSAGMYFSASSSYDPEDEDADWACNAEHYPEDGMFNSSILQHIYFIAYNKSDLCNKAEYTLCLAYGLKLADSAMQEYKNIKPKSKIGYAVGFDSGDFINRGWN